MRSATDERPRRSPIDEIPVLLDAARSEGVWTPSTRSMVFHDLARMDADLVALGLAFPPGTLHSVAIKANPLVEVLRSVVGTGAGLEAASWEEVQLAKAAGCDPDRIVFNSPAKTDDELRAALDIGVWLNADHEEELERLSRMGPPRDSRIGLRVNPGSGSGRIEMTSTVGLDSKFGEPLTRAGELVGRFPFVSGLHVHSGSQGVALELITDATHAVSETVEDLGLEWLDIGGGLPVRYTDDDPEPPSLDGWVAALEQIPSWSARTLITELGRWIQAGRGWALTRVEAVKEVSGLPTLVVHLGADFLMRRVYRPEDWDHEMIVLDPDGRPRAGEVIDTAVGGPLCFNGDFLARRRPLAQARRGDLLLIRDVGAYTLALWSRHCNRGLPPVCGYRGADLVPLFAGESADDVVRHWSLRRPSV